MIKRKKKDKIIIPIYETNPVDKAEEGNERTVEDAVKMAKKWVEENKL